MGQLFTNTSDPTGLRNSVLVELTKDFPKLLRSSKLLLGLQHSFTTACRHAVAFPSDRITLAMLWDEFRALPVADRAELLLMIRK